MHIACKKFSLNVGIGIKIKTKSEPFFMTLEFYSNHILSKTFEFDFDSNFPRWLPPLNEFHQRKKYQI